MYIRKTVKKYKDKTYTNYLLVESIMTEKGPRQRALCSLGDLGPRPREEWIALAHKIQDALSGQASLLDSEPDGEVRAIAEKVRARGQRSAGGSVSIQVDQVRTGKLRLLGPLQVARHFYAQLDLDRILAEAKLSRRARQLTEVMVLGRLICPSSERATADWVSRTALVDLLEADLESLHESSLYRNMDRLYGRREAIERALAEREKSLFELEETIFMYDLTSTYFEGQCAKNPAAQRGYSRDHRFDARQVVIGLVVDREGFPKAHEVFDGNRHDSTTVQDMLKVLEKRVGAQRQALVVVDRGMSGAENLEQIRQHGYDYLVAVSAGRRDEYLDQMEAESGWTEVVRTPSPNNAFQNKTRIRVRSVGDGQEHLILCFSEPRQAKDRAIREKQEGRFLEDVNKLRRRIARGQLKDAKKIHQSIGRLKERYSRVARYYVLEYTSRNGFSWRLEGDKRQRAAQLDGTYLLKTSRQGLQDHEIWLIYSLLTRVENAFRSLKTPLAERPIFHQLQRRAETHIFLCVLALHLLVAIEKTLRDRGVYTSWTTVRDSVSTHQVGSVTLPASNGDVLTIRKPSTPEPEVRRLYDLLGVPHTVMKPIKTWKRRTTS
ncbi:MAG TPA: IS1634 family transposase [Armatimonadota bacterium]|nr:IS1634 family transposase [Armatimonadota bacterium]